MAGGEVLLPAHIQHQALLAVDQGGQLAAAQALPAFAQLGEDQQRQQNNEQSAQYIVGSGKFNQIGKHVVVPGR
ncbi:hypothetical protein D3C86_2156540 [compost metagenome]